MVGWQTGNPSAAGDNLMMAVISLSLRFSLLWILAIRRPTR